MGQGNCSQQVVVRSIRDHTLMQSQSISQMTLGSDPEHLFGSLGWLRDILKTVAHCILELQCQRLTAIKRDVTHSAVVLFAPLMPNYGGRTKNVGVFLPLLNATSRSL